MNSEDNKKIELSELTEDALKKVSGGDDEIDGENSHCLLCCTECGTWWGATTMVCPNCGKNAEEEIYGNLKMLCGLRRNS